jgi:hypothetical protein
VWVVRTADGRTLGQWPRRVPLPSWPQQRPANASDRTRNLYVREDILLIELIQRLMVDGDACDSRALEVVAHLRSQAVVIVHDRTGWRVAAWDEG